MAADAVTEPVVTMTAKAFTGLLAAHKTAMTALDAEIMALERARPRHTTASDQAWFTVLDGGNLHLEVRHPRAPDGTWSHVFDLERGEVLALLHWLQATYGLEPEAMTADEHAAWARHVEDGARRMLRKTHEEG